jgi:predicted ABC-type ATPase
MPNPAPKKIIIIAGPNGAGKTTFARAFLPAEANLPRFINADAIAAGLAAFAPETAAIRAGRLMLDEIELCARRGESFAFETTLSGRHGFATSRSGARRVTGSVSISSAFPMSRLQSNA